MAKDLSFSLMVVIAAGLWGTVGIFSRQLLAYGITPIGVSNIKVLIAAAVLGVFLVISKRDALKIQVRDIPRFIILGAVGISATNVLYVMAIDIIPLGITCTLQSIAPCFVIFLSMVFLHEAITKLKILALVLAFTGCVLIAGISDTDNIVLIGAIYGLISGFCYAMYTIFGKTLVKKYNTYTIEFYAFFIGGIVTIPIMGTDKIIDVVANTSDAWAYIIGSAIFNVLIPYFLYNKGLEHIEAGKVSILACFEPFMATFVGLTCFSEVPTALTVFGMLLIISAIVIISNGKKVTNASKSV